MHSKTLSLTLLLVASVFVAAQDEIEPTCPGPCAFGEFDEDRLLSDCIAQCNTTFGDPDDAAECVNSCSEWQDAISCEATPLVSRRSLNDGGRRRRTSSEATSAVAMYQRSDLDHEFVVDAVEHNSDLSVERRDGLGSCISGCYAKVHTVSICPGNALAFFSQVAA